MDDPDLQALIKADRENRELRATERYKQLLQTIQTEDQCAVIPVITIRGGSIEAGVEIKSIN